MRLATVQKRNAFTLVELLVVIAIIVILMALTVGVISKVYVYLDEVKVTSEVNRMAQACEQFKSTFGRYPPSKIMLCENPANYGAFAPGTPQAILAGYSSEYLSSAFPGLLTSGSLVDWSGTGVTPASPRIFILEGSESLVYFLGGIRIAGGATTGFNTDKSRLVTPSTGARLGPFFEFDSGRLANGPVNGAFFQAYRDQYGTAYAYFATRTPGMNNYYHVGAPQLVGASLAVQEYLSDCPIQTRRIGSATPDYGYVPLVKQVLAPPGAAVIYHKADSYQIVSAGKDKLFGCGGLWNQADPETSNFNFMNSVNVPPLSVTLAGASVPDMQATYDNITNVTGGRVVPK